jgi:hypothetical protein
MWRINENYRVGEKEMTSKKINLEKIAGEIKKLTELRGNSITTDEYCSLTLQLRHYKSMYQVGYREQMTIKKIRRYNDFGAV